MNNLNKKEIEEMYYKILNKAYNTAKEYPKYKGIMLYEAQVIIDILKEYLFE